LPLKRQITVLTALVIIAMLCMYATAQSFLRREAAEKILPVVEEKYTSYETAAYILKERNGYVAVFSSKTDQLLEMTSIPVGSLREGDQALLESGIAADSDEALLTLLEDFNS